MYLTITTVLGEPSFDTVICFDTKKDTYLLLLEASIRKANRLTEEKQIAVKILIRMNYEIHSIQPSFLSNLQNIRCALKIVNQ
ncbi:hypothetical protein CLV96_1027 [Leptospira meyeri]|uniref:Uncharacterized protein n=1 Tax=Leptospira meyeri TaxID=29508 RepID=A0A4R8MYL0_LEPME|nr:hypothetical protein [Leptospira meyeri]EKJ85113.1 hypothetical protein LEP1GSC017_2929 [Leptospira meyeri serovar Hardjo str. Went 5]TDY72046.1 hypothetical protein CLV96_1027 [Leptospira meyeri]